VTILHFCSRDEWAAAQAAGEYAGDILGTDGFIHCSTVDLVLLPANAIARGRTDLVLLEVEPSALPAPPRYEPGDGPGSPLFPHIYGPIPVAAVVAVHDFPPGPDGTFQVPAALA
jgi:uncharacterized protein (DUF952 family)